MHHKSTTYKEPTRCNFGQYGAATTVFSTPDDGRSKHPKHVQCTCSG